MLDIRPVSDLRNKFSEIENAVLSSGKTVFLTKNGYGSMVLLSLEQYSVLTEGIEMKLLQADAEAKKNDLRYSAEDVFSRVRGRINE